MVRTKDRPVGGAICSVGRVCSNIVGCHVQMHLFIQQSFNEPALMYLARV